MTTIFDGLASTINGVLGGSVTVLPGGIAPSYELRAMFRRDPVSVLGAEGSELVALRPLLHVPLDLAGDLRRGDVIQPGDGKSYKILSRDVTGSPASDAFQIFELEEVQ